jgi:uncharacterized protein
MRLQKGSLLMGPGGPVASKVYVADTIGSRLRGVLGRPALAADEALVIKPCSQIHTFGVRYDLDAVFCDDRMRVLHVETVPPGRMSKRVAGADVCVELLGGRAATCGVAEGAVLHIEELP